MIMFVVKRRNKRFGKLMPVRLWKFSQEWISLSRQVDGWSVKWRNKKQYSRYCLEKMMIVMKYIIMVSCWWVDEDDYKADQWSRSRGDKDWIEIQDHHTYPIPNRIRPRLVRFPNSLGLHKRVRPRQVPNYFASGQSWQLGNLTRYFPLKRNPLFF